MKCVNFRKHVSNTLQGFADIETYIDGKRVVIGGFTLHRKDGRSWVSLPSKEYSTADGERAFANLFYFQNKEDFFDFCKAVKECIINYEDGNTVDNKVDVAPTAEEFEEDLPF